MAGQYEIQWRRTRPVWSRPGRHPSSLPSELWRRFSRRTRSSLRSVQAVVLAGGLGTRLRPLTNRTPKPLLPLMGVPFAYRLIRQLAESGVTSATLLVGADPAPWREAGQIGAALGV